MSELIEHLHRTADDRVDLRSENIHYKNY
jgi:hypothetical protein